MDQRSEEVPDVPTFGIRDPKIIQQLDEFRDFIKKEYKNDKKLVTKEYKTSVGDPLRNVAQMEKRVGRHNSNKLKGESKRMKHTVI